MPAIPKTDMSGFGRRALAEVTLNGTNDTFVYAPRKRAILVLRNPTGAAISPVIDGNGGTTVPVAGVGNVDVSGGFAVGAIAAGAAVAIPLDTIAEYLKGTIAITASSGLVGALLEY